MPQKEPDRIESGYCIVGEAKAYLQVPTFNGLQKMTVKELLSVPAIERLVGIKTGNFFSKFATKEAVIDLVAAITMIPLCLCEGVVQICGEHIKDTVEARSALLILKASDKISEGRAKGSLFSFLMTPKSLFFDAMFTALDYIAKAVAETKSLKERHIVTNRYMDSLDAMMLSLEYIANTSNGTEVLLDALTTRYTITANSVRHNCIPLNPLLMLLDVAYVNNFMSSLLCKDPPIVKSIATKINDFLVTTCFIDIVFYYLLPKDLIEALQSSPYSSNPLYIPLVTFAEVSTWLYAESIKDNQVRNGAQQEANGMNNHKAHLSGTSPITEDVLTNAVELLCQVMVSGDILLIGSIVRYLPTVACILFSPELLCMSSLHTLKLICTFSSTSISMILRAPRLYIAEVLGSDEPRSNINAGNKDLLAKFSLHSIIDHLATIAISGEKTTCIDDHSESADTVLSSSQSKIERIKLSQALLPNEVETELVPVYNVYIEMLAQFLQHHMPKMVSGRFDSDHLARISVTMKHLASIFCILDDIGKMLYLATNSVSTEALTLYIDGNSLTKKARYDYNYCVRIPQLGTISTTCPDSINLCETYLIKGRIISPSPLSIFACVFPPPEKRKNPLLTLQLMLFSITTGQQTIIKHYATRILSSIIVFSADSTELFKRVILDSKLFAFLPSLSLKKNRNPFFNLVCEILLRVCLRCNDTCWRLYKEQLAGYYRNENVDTKQELTYPLSLSNIDPSPTDEDTSQVTLIRSLIDSPDFVIYVQSVLEADHNRYIKSGNTNGPYTLTN
ncbi:Hypothetical protein GLP15_458 [Giardia lamblia P15]|uniref:Uncharacterized protein n=1 Tax=Giardia intestinalis (strain P15) TaxID=658858 RepID=E1F094_GIAIA|nr:Hypothetical protein GLP15_458 [Giardia lamblia P15]